MIYRNYINYLKDLFYISFDLNDDEIFVRILSHPKHFSSDFSLPIQERKLKEFFIPYKGGVSINRNRYITENKIKKRAREFTGYGGFAIFNLKIFYQSIEEYNQKYKGNTARFIPSIVASPLNKKGEKLKLKIVLRCFKGNLSHADIIYGSDVALGEPQTTYRNFSRILAQKCIVLKDEFKDFPQWKQHKFNRYL